MGCNRGSGDRVSEEIEGQDNGAEAIAGALREVCTEKLDRRRLLQHSLAGGAALMTSTLPFNRFMSQAFALESAPVVEATWDTDQVRATPVPHRYLHGLIRSHVRFQVLLPVAWNGKIAIFTRGFSGTELSTETFQPAALTKGYAFASCDEGWSRPTIADNPQDDYYESRQSLVELTVYTKALVLTHYGRAASRTLLVGSSNGGHHTRWMVEAYPLMFDGGISGFGYNSQLTQWGSVARLVRNYDVIAPRIDDIIAERAKNARWDPFREHLSPPLTKAQVTALRNIYDIPMELTNGFRYNDGRWFGSEANWKSNYSSLLGYLRDSIPRWDESYRPSGGRPTDAEIKLWDPLNSPAYIQFDLRREDCNGHLARPLIIMHGASDPIVGPGEAEGYKNLVAKTIGPREAEKLLAVYYIAGMGHGGPEYNNLVPAQIDALESMVDYQQSNGSRGAPAPAVMGIYPREPVVGSGNSLGFYDHPGQDRRKASRSKP
jgi:pimeloyl-ACP methyl ester carboxylesterase